ncbi:MAG: PHP domain-containing protein [Candidatus Gracilibacteria bacterium]|nr:PHP domain-containing protein [Candidatus Gracilibacteria bacterium]MDD2908877.1 PHP domain-containing protein [Candidatus Gracilibacteria bacterium]
MQLKSSLHLHSREDTMDGKIIDYTIFELIDYVEQKLFKVLAFTPHEKFVHKQEYTDYAKAKGILLIPSIELAICKTWLNQIHIIILNCTEEVEKITNFKELREYKANHQDCLIIAPHPAFDKLNSISLNLLEKNIDIFDALEHSWFYGKYRNANNKSSSLAKKYNKPIISTSDAHFLDFIDTDYSIIESEKLEISEIFTSIKSGKFQNFTKPKSFKELFSTLVKMVWRNIFRKSIK